MSLSAVVLAVALTLLWGVDVGRRSCLLAVRPASSRSSLWPSFWPPFLPRCGASASAIARLLAVHHHHHHHHRGSFSALLSSPSFSRWLHLVVRRRQGWICLVGADRSSMCLVCDPLGPRGGFGFAPRCGGGPRPLTAAVGVLRRRLSYLCCRHHHSFCCWSPSPLGLVGVSGRHGLGLVCVSHVCPIVLIIFA